MEADSEGSGSVSKRELFRAMERAQIKGIGSSDCLRELQRVREAPDESSISTHLYQKHHSHPIAINAN